MPSSRLLRVLLPIAGVLMLVAVIAGAAEQKISPLAAAFLTVLAAVPTSLFLARRWTAFLLDRRMSKAKKRVLDSPSDPDAQYEFGLLLALEGDEPAARAAYEKAREIRPGHAAATVALGRLLEESDPPGALALFEQAAETDPKLFAAHYAIGTYQLERDQFARAAAAFEHALACDPDDGFAHVALARALLELGQVDESAKHAQLARKQNVVDDELLRDLKTALHEE